MCVCAHVYVQEYSVGTCRWCVCVMSPGVFPPQVETQDREVLLNGVQPNDRGFSLCCHHSAQ